MWWCHSIYPFIQYCLLVVYIIHCVGCIFAVWQCTVTATLTSVVIYGRNFEQATPGFWWKRDCIENINIAVLSKLTTYKDTDTVPWRIVAMFCWSSWTIIAICITWTLTQTYYLSYLLTLCNISHQPTHRGGLQLTDFSHLPAEADHWEKWDIQKDHEVS